MADEGQQGVMSSRVELIRIQASSKRQSADEEGTRLETTIRTSGGVLIVPIVIMICIQNENDKEICSVVLLGYTEEKLT